MVLVKGSPVLCLNKHLKRDSFKEKETSASRFVCEEGALKANSLYVPRVMLT